MAKVKIPTRLVDVVLPENQEDSPSKDEQKLVAGIAKQIIIDVLEQGITPKLDAPNDEGSVSFYYNLTFPQNWAAQIRQHMREHKQPEGLMLFHLLSAGVEKELYVHHLAASEESTHMMSEYLSPLSLTPRKEQLILSDAISNTLSHGGIGLVEGGTGIGKTLAILANANQVAMEKGQRSVIATNTISNIQQLAKSYATLSAAGVNMAPLRIVLGRNSFVSIERLNRYLNEECIPKETQAKIKTWAKTGVADDRDVIDAPAYLISELVAIYPEIATSEVTLTGELADDDPGVEAYRSQFVREGIYPEIILCTHAMLAVDAKTRRISLNRSDHDMQQELSSVKADISARFDALAESTGEAKRILLADIEQLRTVEDRLAQSIFQDDDSGVLPVYQYLFIDEAHLFEEVVSQVISANISMRSFLKDIEACCEAGVIPVAKHKDILKEAALILHVGERDQDSDKIELGPGVEYFHAIARIVSLLKSLRRFSKLPESLKNDINVLQRAINQVESPYHHFSLTFSPIRRYPQIMAGEINTQPYLRAIWQQVTAAVCVSATLYFPKMGGYSCSYFANNLAVPQARLKTYTPITPPWLKNNVEEVLLPPNNPDAAQRYVPAGRRQSNDSAESREAMRMRWLETVSTHLISSHAKGVGGTLVLMTSFADVNGLAGFLSDVGHPVVMADGNATTEAQKLAYLAALRKGKKPIWLAVGGAWTGLDITGKDIGLEGDEIAEHDNVITTLVIPKLPFGLNQSLSHYSRMAKSHKQSTLEVMEAVIRLKQGLGRLIRLANQPKNRRILILDGRLSLPDYKGFLGPIRRIIETYPRVNHLSE